MPLQPARHQQQRQAPRTARIFPWMSGPLLGLPQALGPAVFISGAAVMSGKPCCVSIQGPQGSRTSHLGCWGPAMDQEAPSHPRWPGFQCQPNTCCPVSAVPSVILQPGGGAEGPVQCQMPERQVTEELGGSVAGSSLLILQPSHCLLPPQLAHGH